MKSISLRVDGDTLHIGFYFRNGGDGAVPATLQKMRDLKIDQNITISLQTSVSSKVLLAKEADPLLLQIYKGASFGISGLASKEILNSAYNEYKDAMKDVFFSMSIKYLVQNVLKVDLNLLSKIDGEFHFIVDPQTLSEVAEYDLVSPLLYNLDWHLKNNCELIPDD